MYVVPLHVSELRARALRAIRRVLGADFFVSQQTSHRPANLLHSVDWLKANAHEQGADMMHRAPWLPGQLTRPFGPHFANAVLEHTVGVFERFGYLDAEIDGDWALAYFNLLETLDDPGPLTTALWIEVFKSETIQPGYISVQLLYTLASLDEFDLELLRACAACEVRFKARVSTLMLTPHGAEPVMPYILGHSRFKHFVQQGMLMPMSKRVLHIHAPGICRTAQGAIAYRPSLELTHVALDIGPYSMASTLAPLVNILNSASSPWRSRMAETLVSMLRGAGLEAVPVFEDLETETLWPAWLDKEAIFW